MITGFKDLRDHLFSNGHVQQLKKQFNIGSESPLSFDHFQSSKQSISTSPNPTQIQSSPVQTNPVAAAATQLDPAVYAQQIARATAAARFSEQLSNSATSPSGGSSGFNLFGQLQANIQRIIARQTLNRDPPWALNQSPIWPQAIKTKLTSRAQIVKLLLPRFPETSTIPTTYTPTHHLHIHTVIFLQKILRHI